MPPPRVSMNDRDGGHGDDKNGDRTGAHGASRLTVGACSEVCATGPSGHIRRMASAEGDGQQRDSGGEVDTKLKRSIGPTVLTVFVIGDILGAGIYALVGEVGAEVGGAIWTAFLVAFVLAFFTRVRLRRARHQVPAGRRRRPLCAQGLPHPVLTFIVAFAVMSSGIASAATLSRAFAGRLPGEFIDLPIVLAAIVFILLVALINLRGIAESTNLNVVLTAIEVTGLVLIVVVGVAALGEGSGDFSRNFEFKEGDSTFSAIVGGTVLAFYAMIGFEDSVNVAEEAKQPSRNYPRALFVGICSSPACCTCS